MYYICHKVNVKRRGSYINSPNWIKNKQATTNPKNEDDKCFQYEVTVALIYEEIKFDPERVSNIKPFIKKYNWKGINYPSKIDDWKTFEKNNLTIAFKSLYIEKGIHPGYISKHNLTREKQKILLIIPNEEKEGSHFLAVKKISVLLHRKTSKHKRDFYCLNCLHSFRTENSKKTQKNSNLMKKYVKIKISVEW